MAGSIGGFEYKPQGSKDYQKQSTPTAPAWQPPKQVQQEEEEGGGGGSGGVATQVANGSSPWGSFRGGAGWSPQMDDGNVGGFKYNPSGISETYLDKFLAEQGAALNKRLSEAFPLNAEGNPIYDPTKIRFTDDNVPIPETLIPIDYGTPDKPTPTPAEPMQQTPTWGSKTLQRPANGNWGDPRLAGGFQYLPNSKDWRAQGMVANPNDWSAQGQVTFDQLAGLDKGFSVPEIQPMPAVIAEPSSPAVANGFPDRVNPNNIPADVRDTKTMLSGGNPPITKRTDGFAYLPFGGVPPKKEDPPKKIDDKKKSWGGYGGGSRGGGGGGYQSWQDFLGNMNWKI